MANPQSAPAPQGPQWGATPNLAAYAARINQYHQFYDAASRGQPLASVNSSPLENILNSTPSSFRPLRERGYRLVQLAAPPQNVAEWPQRLQQMDQLLREAEADPQLSAKSNQLSMLRGAVGEIKGEIIRNHAAPRHYLEPGTVPNEPQEERQIQNAYNVHYGIPPLPEPTPPSFWERQKRNIAVLGTVAALLLGASGAVPLLYESKMDPVPVISTGSYHAYQLTAEELNARSEDGKSVMLNRGERMILRDGADGTRVTASDYTGDGVRGDEQLGWFNTVKDGKLTFTVNGAQGVSKSSSVWINVAEDSGFLRYDNDADANADPARYTLPANITNLLKGFSEIAGAVTPEEQKALTLSVTLETTQPLRHGQFPYHLAAKTADGKAVAQFDPRNGTTMGVDDSWLLAENLHIGMQDNYTTEGFSAKAYGTTARTPSPVPAPVAKTPAPVAEASVTPEPISEQTPETVQGESPAAGEVGAAVASLVAASSDGTNAKPDPIAQAATETPYKTIRLPIPSSFAAGFTYQFTDVHDVAVNSGTINQTTEGLESRIAPAAQSATFTAGTGTKGYRVHAVTYGDGRAEHVSKKKTPTVQVTIENIREVYVSSYGKNDLKEHSHRWWRNDSPKKDLEHGRMKKFKHALRDPAQHYDRLSAIARQDPEFSIGHFTRTDAAANRDGVPAHVPEIRIAFDHGMWDNFTKKEQHLIPQPQFADLVPAVQTQLEQRFPGVSPEDLHIRPVVTINPKQAFAFDAPEGYQITMLPLAAGSDSSGEFWHPNGTPVLWKKAGMFERLINNQAEPITQPKRLARAAEKPGKVTADINPNNHTGMRKFHLKRGTGAYEIRVTDRQGSTLDELPVIAQKGDLEALMVQVNGRWYAIAEDVDGRTWVERT